MYLLFIRALEGLHGVENVKAGYPEKSAEVVYNSALVSPEQMKQALLKSGYVASVVEDKGMSGEILQPIVGQKAEFKPDDLVCYCFGHTRKDIEQDFLENGTSTIMAKIATEKKRGGCDCTNKNPKGR